MDTLFALVASLLFWRAALVTFAAFTIAVTAAALVPWFTGAYGLGVVIAAFAAGLLWEAEARSKTNVPSSLPKTRLSPPVAALALAFFGVIAGGWAGAIAGSAWVGALALVAGAAAVALYASRVRGQPFAWRSFIQSACAMLAGFACLVALSSPRA